MSDAAGLSLEVGGDYKTLIANTDRAFAQVMRGMDQVEARANGLEKRLAAMGKSFNGKHIVNEVNGIHGALSRLNGVDAEKALSKVFDSSKLTLLNEAGARLRIFGSALEPLGPLGLAAAGGILAVGLAFDQARKAADWAEALERAAKAIGVTTTTLQEFDFVAQASGIPVDKMRETLKSLTGQIGELQDNFMRVKNGPQVKVWEAVLGKPGDAHGAEEQLRQLGDLQHILPVLADYVAKLSGSQRAGVAKALMIDPEVLDSWVTGKTDIAALIDQAHKMGLVFDEDVIRKSADAAQQMHVASAVIDDEFRRAFIDLAPAAAGAATKLADVAKHISDVVDEVKDALYPIGQLIGYLDQIKGLKGEASKALGDVWAGVSGAFNPLGVLEGKGLSLLAADGRQARQGDELGARLAARGAAYGEKPPAAVKALVPDDAKKTHSTAEHNASATWEALKAYDEALIKAAKSLEAEHQARLTLIADTRKAALDKAAKDKSLTPATRSMVEKTAGMTFDADMAAENARYVKAQREHAKSIGDQLAKFSEAQLAAQADIASTTSARQAAERKKLLDEQQQAQSDLGDKIKGDKAYQSPQGQIEAYRLMIAQIAAQQAARAAQDADFAKAAANEETETKLRTLGFEEQSARAAESIARTNTARKAAAEALLEIEQRAAQARLDQENREKRTPGAGQGALDADFAAQRTDLDTRYAAPLAKFADSETGDLGEQLQASAVSAMKALNEGLAEAIVNGKSLHEVLRQALKKQAASLLQQGLGRAEGGLLHAVGLGGGVKPDGTRANPLYVIMASALAGGLGAGAPGSNVGPLVKQILGGGGGGGAAGAASAAGSPGAGSFLSSLGAVTSVFKLFGFADGTRSAPGGLSVVGERGPELMNVPRGAQIFSNGSLNAMSRGLSGQRNVVGAVSISNSYDMRGVVTDADLNARLELARRQTVSEATSAAQRSMGAWNAQAKAESG